ncbi:MAG TPA: 4'-phosphopantetheinyl transferase superfamily protein [Spirochaetia bacterium]|nr:4'-phosphopantetheinyl transferase superfamily protein [Spirochaetia bacterium]
MLSELVLLSFNLGSLSASESEALLATSTQELPESVRAYHKPVDRLRFSAGRALLRCGLRGITGKTDFEVELDKYGRPFLKGHPEIDFNIAHSGDWVLCLIGRDRRVGVDVEFVGQIFEEVLDRLSTTEIEYVDSHNGMDRIEAFYRVWTAKEAYLKASGETFEIPPDSFTILFIDGNPALSDFDSILDIDWNLQGGSLDERHLYCACYTGKATQPRPIEVTFRELITPR